MFLGTPKSLAELDGDTDPEESVETANKQQVFGDMNKEKVYKEDEYTKEFDHQSSKYHRGIENKLYDETK